MLIVYGGSAVMLRPILQVRAEGIQDSMVVGSSFG